MDTKKLRSLVFICFFSLSIAFGQNTADIKVQKSAEKFAISLELENAKDLSKVKIQGFAFAKGKSTTFNIVFDSDELKKHKNGKFELHELSNETDYALYTITSYDKEGNRKQYPSQKVNMPDGYSFSSRY